MIAGSGFTLTQTGAALLKGTISTASTNMSRLADAMYTMTVTMIETAKAIEKLSWPEIWNAWWNYVKRLTVSKSPRAKRPVGRATLNTKAPTEYG
jgi:hypothetical protein